MTPELAGHILARLLGSAFGVAVAYLAYCLWVWFRIRDRDEAGELRATYRRTVLPTLIGFVVGLDVSHFQPSCYLVTSRESRPAGTAPTQPVQDGDR